ncbi:hypothetical protein [Nocardioides bruguierae]|uniref:Uncharacterized protein n=1 Tax=Nocardioides bruguierae TaxID=2945102 RepID=A0A9X2IHA9_9ACTN|nr:hypothetical protein [Nocardioides bruguierae]MCM0622419.1 hypothetical protein [Nocardioides bruguierae]
MKFLVFGFLSFLMLAVGILWTGESFGWWGEEPTSGSGTAVLGPPIAGLGVAMAIVVVQQAVKRD